MNSPYDLQHAGRRFRRWARYAGISSAVCLLAPALMFDLRSYLATIVVVALAKPIIVVPLGSLPVRAPRHEPRIARDHCART